MVSYLKQIMDERRNVGEKRERKAGDVFQADFILPRVGYSRVLLLSTLCTGLCMPSYSLFMGLTTLSTDGRLIIALLLFQ